MVAGQLYKKFKTQIGGFCYLLSRKKLTNKMMFVSDHMAVSLTWPHPRRGGWRRPPLLREEQRWVYQGSTLQSVCTWQMKLCKWSSNYKHYSKKRKTNDWNLIKRRMRDTACFSNMGLIFLQLKFQKDFNVCFVNENLDFSLTEIPVRQPHPWDCPILKCMCLCVCGRAGEGGWERWGKRESS